MLHELKLIISTAQKAQNQGLKSVFVSVVALDGSSYRRPGVRMLILEDGTMVGAVSGGCVEKEIARQSETVFKDGQPKLMTYDGRFRLGCDGILYLLIEPFHPDEAFFEGFYQQLKARKSLQVRTYFSKEESFRRTGGTQFLFSEKNTHPVVATFDTKMGTNDDLDCFEQVLEPSFRLFIIGAEHDAVSLCTLSAQAGWEVSVIAAPDENKSLQDFPGATQFLAITEDAFEEFSVDKETAVVLMSHSLVKDLKFLSALRNKTPAYLGLLGPSRRKDRIIEQLLEYYEDTPLSFLDSIHGPCGVNIGAETPQEIAISIMAEILAVIREQDPILLKDKKTGIHQ